MTTPALSLEQVERDIQMCEEYLARDPFNPSDTSHAQSYQRPTVLLCTIALLIF